MPLQPTTIATQHRSPTRDTRCLPIHHARPSLFEIPHRARAVVVCERAPPPLLSLCSRQAHLPLCSTHAIALSNRLRKASSAVRCAVTHTTSMTLYRYGAAARHRSACRPPDSPSRRSLLSFLYTPTEPVTRMSGVVAQLAACKAACTSALADVRALPCIGPIDCAGRPRTRRRRILRVAPLPVACCSHQCLHLRHARKLSHLMPLFQGCQAHRGNAPAHCPHT